jgi:hypothetical protein
MSLPLRKWDSVVRELFGADLRFWCLEKSWCTSRILVNMLTFNPSTVISKHFTCDKLDDFVLSGALPV